MNVPHPRSLFDVLAGIDFESFYSPSYGLKKLTTEAYVRDPRFEVIGCAARFGPEPSRWYSAADLAERARSVDWSRTALLAHHAHFDGLIAAHHLGIRPVFWFDTLSMARALHGTEVGGSLERLAVYYGAGQKGHEVKDALGKRREDFTPEELAAYGRYSCNDLDLTFSILRAMLGRGFPAVELWHIDSTIRMFTEPSFVLNESRLRAAYAAELARKAEFLRRSGVDKGTLSSSDKFAALLKSLGVDPPHKPSPKHPDTEIWAFAANDHGMQALLEHEDESIRWLAEARVEVKSTINETRMARFLAAGAGGRRLPVYLKYAGAHTYRWSGGDKMNFQNLQRGGELRACLEAPPGEVLVVADSGAIEARGVAWLAGQADLVEAFKTGADLYSQFASRVYGRPVDRKKKNPDGTKPDETPGMVGKVSILGLGYGMGWAKFADTLLKGPMGAAPIQFSEADARQLGVDVDAVAVDVAILEDPGEPVFVSAFLADARRRTTFRKMISRLDRVELGIHCAAAWVVVQTYRKTYPAVVTLWRTMSELIQCMLDGTEAAFGPGGVLRTRKDALLLPNGLELRYPELKYSHPVYDEDTGEEIGGGYSYRGGHGGKERVRLYGGSMTENIVQALARIVVADQLLQCRLKYGLRLVTMSHDEGVFSVPEADGAAMRDAVVAEMKISPEWAPDWPLTAEGGCAKSYGEAK